MAHAHDRAVFQLGGDGEASGQRFALDDERVVAAYCRFLRQSCVKALPVVADGRRLAVHDLLGTHDAAAEDFADRLMTEADAEERHLAFRRFDQRLKIARILRQPRTRREDHGLVSRRQHILGRCGIVSHDLDLCAEGCEKLVDIIGK